MLLISLGLYLMICYFSSNYHKLGEDTRCSNCHDEDVPEHVANAHMQTFDYPNTLIAANEVESFKHFTHFCLIMSGFLLLVAQHLSLFNQLIWSLPKCHWICMWFWSSASLLCIINYKFRPQSTNLSSNMCYCYLCAHIVCGVCCCARIFVACKSLSVSFRFHGSHRHKGR